ncbi:threonine synthase [Haloarculaceae archaeon H-GB11]|nr:threonine synthase [Haloarculaceae archaeon H-GB11]
MTQSRDADTSSVATHLQCRSCGDTYDLDTTRFPCASCGGILDPQYDYDAVDIGREAWENRSGSMWTYRELLPIRDEDAVVTMGEGQTPLVDCPGLAEEMGVERLLIKDEGQNPTNTFKDRGQSAAISAANEQGAETVALPSAGNAGQSASAYAARAGMDCHVFLNHQAGDVKKDLVRAHGAQLHLVDGKISHAGAAFNEARDDADWYSVATFQTPFRHEGKKTMGFEIFEQLDWSTPDHVVYPTGGGVGLVGIWKAYEELRRLDWLDDPSPPKMDVAQSEETAPVVRAIETGATEHSPWERPESIAHGVEIPDPGASPWILDIVAESGGSGAAVHDTRAIDAAIDAARKEGVEMCVTSAVALAGAMKLAERGDLSEDDEVVIINTGAGVKSAGQLGRAVC